MAATDWDLDGDVDLWLINRTGPRVRFANNRIQTDNRFLLLSLEGLKGNRDAVGARVEVTLDDGARTLIKSLRAGDGFIAQSSKWLHFGLGDSRLIDRVVVRWPGGAVEDLAGLESNGRYRIVTWLSR